MKMSSKMAKNKIWSMLDLTSKEMDVSVKPRDIKAVQLYLKKKST